MVQRAQALSKAPLGLYHLAYAVAYLSEQQYAEAFRSVLQVDAHNWVFAQVVTAAAAAHAGRLDVAREAAERIRDLYPEFELEALGNFEYGRFDRAFHEALVTGLTAAGLQLRDPHVPVSGG
jgi:hypothetical protein